MIHALLGIIKVYVSLVIKVIVFGMEFAWELNKIKSKIKDVRYGIGIDNSVFNALTDMLPEMVVVYPSAIRVHHGIHKDFVIVALKAIIYQTEYALNLNKLDLKIKAVRDGTGIIKYVTNVLQGL